MIVNTTDKCEVGRDLFFAPFCGFLVHELRIGCRITGGLGRKGGGV
jgi:hypothetical protein